MQSAELNHFKLENLLRWAWISKMKCWQWRQCWCLNQELQQRTRLLSSLHPLELMLSSTPSQKALELWKMQRQLQDTDELKCPCFCNNILFIHFCKNENRFYEKERGISKIIKQPKNRKSLKQQFQERAKCYTLKLRLTSCLKFLDRGFLGKVASERFFLD